MQQLLLYHGSGDVVIFPEIRRMKYTKDFSWGFYCTKSYEQACRWARRKYKSKVVNVYSYMEDSSLKILKSVEEDTSMIMILWRDQWPMIRFGIL